MAAWSLPGYFQLTKLAKTKTPDRLNCTAKVGYQSNLCGVFHSTTVCAIEADTFAEDLSLRRSRSPSASRALNASANWAACRPTVANCSATFGSEQESIVSKRVSSELTDA